MDDPPPRWKNVSSLGRQKRRRATRLRPPLFPHAGTHRFRRAACLSVWRRRGGGGGGGERAASFDSSTRASVAVSLLGLLARRARVLRMRRVRIGVGWLPSQAGSVSRPRRPRIARGDFDPPHSGAGWAAAETRSRSASPAARPRGFVWARSEANPPCAAAACLSRRDCGPSQVVGCLGMVIRAVSSVAEQLGARIEMAEHALL